MPKIFLPLACCVLLPFNLLAQNWGLGVRLGDPAGITLKRYGDGNGLEINFGRTYMFRNANYYHGYYDDWYHDQQLPYHDHQLIDYHASVPLGLQIHYLWQRQLGDVEHLDWYFGFGGQLRMQHFRYDYRYKPGNGPEWVEVYDQRVAETDLGVDGVIGMEYTFPRVPISLFLDATLFMELFDDPFFFRPQAGTGVRFRF